MRAPLTRFALVAGAGCVALLGACASFPSGPSASATLMARSGSSVAGTVSFVEKGSKIVVTADVSGLKPGAEHGFHVHEKGDCSAADATSAGGHFNPGGQPHGNHASGPHHAGDLPNLKADSAGRAKASFEVEGLAVSATAANGIVGRSVVIHRDPDDYKSQPAGNSGPRIACGTIR